MRRLLSNAIAAALVVVIGFEMARAPKGAPPGATLH
jgi:hypothetical protein